MNIDYALNVINNYTGQDAWIAQVFIVVFVTVLVNWIQKKSVARLLKKLKHTRTDWDYALLHAASIPITIFIWVIGFCFTADIVSGQTNAAIFEAVDPIRSVAIIAILTWFLVRFITNVENIIFAKKLEEDRSFDRTTADAIAKLLHVSVIIISGLVILQALGYSISGVLAFGGIGGIAVGFAARDMLANFFGGLTIYLDRPFSVGDWIRSPDKDIEGVVENIGWRVTTIRTFDKRPLYVPNATFTNISVQNPSRMTNRRIKETVGIRYDDVAKISAIVGDVKKMIKEHEDIDHNRIMIVNFDECAASSLNFFVYCLTKTTDWVEYHSVKQDIMLKVIDIIEKHGAECAFPTTTLHVPDGVNILKHE